MTVSAAITLLQQVLARRGDVEVYFDCPACKQSFTPGVVELKAVVITGVGKP